MMRSLSARHSVLVRFGLLCLVTASTACSHAVPDERHIASVPDTAVARGDSMVSALAGPPSYIDSLRAALDSESLAGAMPLIAESANGRLESPVASAGDSSATREGRLRSARAIEATLSARATPARARISVEDTVRGLVKIVGAAPSTRVVLGVPLSRSTIALSGMAADDLRSLAGLDVMVRGIKVSERDVVVSGFVVRAADGNPAWDGRLERAGSAFQLRLTDGSGLKRIAQLPSALRDAAGERVWIAMRAGSTSPQAFGLVGRD